MLVLSRRIGESITIGDGVTVRVERVKGNKVSIAIDAPRDIRIVRAELLDRPEPVVAAREHAPRETTSGRFSLPLCGDVC